tara:strand:+ start:515 stop:721 length:207 start_codon:yes stop_codon:yes gene_type:complete
MEFYTLLTIVYPLMEHDWQFSIWFPSENECWKILTSKGSIYDKINATEGYCQVSDVASKIVKPVARPW